MNKIYMYAHGGSGNHGCEAIVRSTIKILRQIGYENITLISSNPQEDIKYGINEICDIKKDKTSYSKTSIDFLKAYLKLKIQNNYIPMDELAYKKSISEINAGDIALSIGGDNYCYADVEKYIMLHNMMLRQGAKTVLWGCSVEPELINRAEIAEDLKKYSLIVTRESISYEALKKVNPNTILVSDPAFFLDAKNKERKANKDIVGINLSPMAIDKEEKKGITIACYKKLIKHILEFTTMDIVLIPHVVWSNNDDRVPLEMLYGEFEKTGRVTIIEDDSCERIKGVISNCKYFIGARTHSTIAAYSSKIPTMVLGYSVKARGIAKDIFGKEKEFIIPVQELATDEDLVFEFEKLVRERKMVIYQLDEYMKFVDKGIGLLKEEFKRLEG